MFRTHPLFRLPNSSATIGNVRALGWVVAISLTACSPKAPKAPLEGATHTEAVLLRSGSVEVRESDLERHLDDLHAGRRDVAARDKALDELGKTAQLVNAAFGARLENDPVVRAEIARVLANRMKEKTLYPALKGQAVSEARLKEVYEETKQVYQSNEKRQVAVLWLDPGKDPQRVAQYKEKLEAARKWYAESSDLQAHTEKGFAELGVDYSEHQGSRYKGGVVGWLEREGGADAWTRSVAEILFSLNKPGDVSEVMVKTEGLFLVRYMALTPALLRPFESVVSELERGEIGRLKKQAESAFWSEMATQYPIERLIEPSTNTAEGEPPRKP
jgi:hypothetical protein